MHLAEERIIFQCGKSAHIHIGSFQLEFVHFAQLVSQSGLFEGIFPVRVLVIVFFIVFLKTESNVLHGRNIFQHLGNNLFPHLLINLFRFLT